MQKIEAVSVVFQYVPELGRDVWLKTESISDTITYLGKLEKRVCNRLSWSDSESGPFEEIHWQAFGYDIVSGG